MKKVLLFSLSLVLGFSAFAQQRVSKTELNSATASAKKTVVGKEVSTPSAAQFAPQTAKSVVVNRYQDMEYAQTMWTYYDLQSNQYVANRMYQMPDGSVAAVATMSHEANQVASDRGTGYNFYKDGAWMDEPEARVEPFKTGWPTIAQWGETGEILLCHGNGHLQCFTREVAGEGEWVDMGFLPDHPEDYPYNEYATWPRVVTSGDNHNIIHVIACLQHTVSDTEGYVHTVLYRSEDATNWEVSYGPLQELGYEQGSFSADDYCMAANGHNVAILYSGCLTNSVFMFKSTDDGLTWETTKVWEHPFENVELDEPNLDYGDTLFMPMNGAIAIDNNGVVHVALNSFEMTHLSDTEPGYYSYYIGRMVDGILYWNDTQEAPMSDTYHPEYVGTVYEEHFAEPNPFHVARLWWPVADDPGYVHMLPDSTKWIGFVPMYQGSDWDNNKYYNGKDYHSRFYGTSGHPALSIDPQGNIACAYSTPCTLLENESDPYYKRHIYVSYRNVDEGYWHQIVDDITDPEAVFELSGGDNLFTISVPNTVNDGEFWFGFQSDYEVGLYWGTNDEPVQTSATENGIFVMKVLADPEMVSVPESNEAKDVIYGIYPNPATDYVVVKSAMDVEANITIINLVGQTVKQFNKSLKMGDNAFDIDLKSGIYFCNINANGFNKTIKLVVK